MIVVEAITLVAVLSIIVAGAFRFFSAPRVDVPTHVESQRDEAHQILLELHITDELLVFLPAKMRDKIDAYLAKYGGRQ